MLEATLYEIGEKNIKRLFLGHVDVVVSYQYHMCVCVYVKSIGSWLIIYDHINGL